MAQSVNLDFYHEKVGAVDFSPALVLPPTTPVGDAIRAMQDKRCGCAVICDDQGVRGTFTERTVVNRVLASGVDLADPIMAYINTATPTLSPLDTIGAAITHMDESGVRHLPIWDSQKGVVGVLSVRNIIHLLAQFHATEIYNLPPRVRQEMRNVDGA